MIEAVVFDMDGVLIDSEQVWDDVRERLAHERGGRWSERAQRDMMGMSSPEWSRYMHDVVGLPESPEEINREVVARMLERYADGPPWLPGRARGACARLAATLPARARVVVEPRADRRRRSPPAGSPSSSARPSRPRRSRAASRRPTSTSRRRGGSASSPARCVAIEDSHNGIRSAKAAGMRCVAIPNAHYPPGDAVAEADVVAGSLDELTADTLRAS